MVTDMAHIAGLVAAGVHPSPIPHSDIVTTTTHKTLRGPRGGMVLCREAHAKAVNRALFPGVQGGPLMHVIAAKAVCFKEAGEPAFAEYQHQTVKNAARLGSALVDTGFTLVSGGTDNHMVLVDVFSQGITGKVAEAALGKAGITVNKNAIPFDENPPMGCQRHQNRHARDHHARDGGAGDGLDRRLYRPYAGGAGGRRCRRDGPHRGGSVVRDLPALSESREYGCRRPGCVGRRSSEWLDLAVACETLPS